jgi:predicted RND superfamily exporter protein
MTPQETTAGSSRRRLGLALVISRVTLAAMAVAAVWIVPRAAAVLGVDSAPPLEWVPKQFPARVAYQEFIDRFGSGDVVVVSWEGCTLDSPELAELTRRLGKGSATRGVDGSDWFETAISGRGLLDRLTKPPLALPRDTAIDRLVGSLIGPDRETTCIVVPLTRAGLDARREAVAWLRQQIQDLGISPDHSHCAGPVIDNVTVDEASSQSLEWYGLPAAVVVLLLTWRAIGSLLHAGLVFATSLFCVGVAFASLDLMGDRMNSVLIVMPLLVLILGVCNGVHLVNYMIEAAATGPLRDVPRRGLQVGLLPCTLSAMTTAIGLLSLVVSDLEPVRVFGFHAAVGVIATLVLLFLVLPGAFQQWPIRGSSRAPRAFIARVERLSVSAATPIVAVVAIALSVAAAGLSGIRSSVGLNTLFPAESHILADYAWIEQHVGPLAPVEVILQFEGDHTRAAERLDTVREVAEALEATPGVTGVLSAGTFFTENEAASGVRRVMRKAVIARRLESSLASLDDLRLIRREGTTEFWRITARTSVLADLDYPAFLKTIDRDIGPIISRHGSNSSGISFSTTGAMPLVQAIQQSLLHDLAVSFLTACGVISLVMITVQRSVVTGLLGMVVNVFPMLVLFGLLGWGRVPLDIGGVMTASVALGMAIDGTLHFLTFVRRAQADGAGGEAKHPAAVHHAFAHAAPAIFQTAVICSVGMLVFTASSFAPTQRFAWMLATLVVLAVVGDLLVLPALLVSPLGRTLRSRPSSPSLVR